jgi:phosphoribosylanthranilate isomerase
MREQDIDFVNESMPDFIGFVFAKSKRTVSFETASKLKSRLSAKIKTVGVFVNDDIENIVRLCNAGIIDLIQLHGGENEEYILKLKEKIFNPVIKAVKIGQPPYEPSLLKQIAAIGKEDFTLYDSGAGSGKTFDWDLIKNIKTPYFLAGGINIENISFAIKKLNPFCIDISGGVETDGKKDLKKIRDIIRAARIIT